MRHNPKRPLQDELDYALIVVGAAGRLTRGFSGSGQETRGGSTTPPTPPGPAQPRPQPNGPSDGRGGSGSGPKR